LVALPMLIGVFISVVKTDWSAPWSATDTCGIAHSATALCFSSHFGPGPRM
jgi:hypothetical protein